MQLAEPVIDKAEALYYFEEFCIQPMRLNLSFVRTDKIDDKESRYVLHIQHAIVCLPTIYFLLVIVRLPGLLPWDTYLMCSQ